MNCRLGLIAFLFGGFLLSIGCGKKEPVPVAVEAGGQASTTPQEKSVPIGNYIADLKQRSLDKRAAAIRGIIQYDESVAIPALLEVLADKGYTDGAVVVGQPNSTREGAIIALLKFGATGEKEAVEKALPALIALLKDANPGVREHTILAIALLGPKAKNAAGDLLKSCEDGNEIVRRTAYDTLQKVGGGHAADFASMLRNKDPKVVYDAAKALNAIRPLPKEVIGLLVDVLKNTPGEMEPDEAVLTRMEVAEALASFGKDAESAVPVLIKVLQTTTIEDFDKFFRPKPGNGPDAARNDESPAMMALRKIGKPAVNDLKAALNSDKPLVRWQAARVLAGIGPDAAAALPDLQTIFDKEFERKEGQVAVISACGLAIVQIGGDPTKIVGKIAELLAIPDPQLRFDVVRILARFGRKGEAAVMAILPLLDDEQEAIRAQASDTLRAMGPAAKAAIPALGKKLADPQLEVRRSAALTLKGLGPIAAETSPQLAKLLLDEDDAVRRECMETIIAIGPGAKATVPELTKLVKALDARERLLAMDALGVIGPDAKTAAPELLAALAAKDTETRMAAARALGLIGNASTEVVKGLADRLKDTYMPPRQAAARALALLGPAAKAAVDNLKVFGGSNSKSPDPVAVVWSSVALYRLGVDADANLKIVIDAMKNKAVRSARLAAMDAADLLGPSAKGILSELIEALNDKTPISNTDPTPARHRAIKALGKMGPAAKDTVPKLAALLKETDVSVKTAVIETLGQIGPSATLASARLREIVRTEPAYGELAQEALDRIEKK